jgi:hypothetical protein
MLRNLIAPYANLGSKYCLNIVWKTPKKFITKQGFFLHLFRKKKPIGKFCPITEIVGYIF